MAATTIVLPAAPAESTRPPLPLLAATVPVIAGVVLWVITGSMLALCFAALGPVMLLASFFDGIRSRRRLRDRAAQEADAAWQRAEAELSSLHARELETLWHRSPDAAGCLAEPPLRGHEAIDRSTPIVVGRGPVASTVRVAGGDDQRTRGFRERAQVLADGPVRVPIGGGVCVRAPEPVAAAVVRALAMQLCLRFGPADLALCGEGAIRWGLAELPHTARCRSGFALRLGEDAAADGERVDAVLCIRMPGQEPPEGVTTVLDCTVPASAQLRTADGIRELSVEGVSRRQVALVAADLTRRADADTALPDLVMLGELAPAPRSAGGLAAHFLRGRHGDVLVDLVEHGPHAIVTGMTGTGKSELLTSWVAAIAGGCGPDEVSFVLIDFKGGTAFEPLRALPHVTAVVTDLDAQGARRGVSSLTAELRRREAVLARAGARDVSDCTELARLVIVVDEFAALVQEHPDLAQIFTDVAARGRALGMHLVLGTQRASGVIRDALAANCPLRLSLRVAEAADSRFVVGSDAAAAVPGGADSRGLVFLRRPEDAAAHAARVALAAASDLDAIARRWAGRPVPASPWLPALPAVLPVPAADDAGLTTGHAVLGRADEPARQQQPWVRFAPGDGLAVIGGPGSGKSMLVRALAAQLADAVVVPPDGEIAWDAVAELASGRHGIVLCDDVDVLLAQYPSEHAQVFLARWEVIARSPAGTVLTASRASGPIGRLLDALPRRALLGMSSRVEHIAAGGEAAQFDRARTPGRAWLDGRETQLCWTDAAPIRTAQWGVPLWHPSRAWSGLVTDAVDTARQRLAAAHPECVVLSLADLTARASAVADLRSSAADSDDAVRRIVVDEPERWRADWARLQQVRSGGELLVAAECAPELRQLAGVREVPPYARLHENRAWAVEAGRRPRRVVLE